MSLIYRGIPTCVYVEIIAHINSFGKITPKSLIWNDGRVFPISKVHPVGKVSLPDGENALCYECIIQRKSKRIYTKNGRWFVIVDKPFEG